jgi:hypothetical protein
MNSSPSGGEDLHVVQPEKPLPGPADSGAPQSSAPSSPAASASPGSKGRFTFVASLLLIALAFSLGLSYFLEKRWLNRSAHSHSNGATATTLVESGAITAGAPVALGPDAFHVTSIAPGDPRVATVNGQRVSEGHSFVVQTSSGPVTARVEKIEDEVVHFAADGKMVDARVNPALAQEPKP